MAGRVNGFSLAYTAVGAVVMWSGIKGSTISDTFRGLLSGQTPPSGTEQITGSTATPAATGGGAAGDTAAHSKSAAANQAIARLLAAPYGWSTGTEWEDLVSLWNAESGWSNTAENSSSGAYGIAQALGHGPTNQYPAGPANPPTSSAPAQIAWGLSYIKDTYGDPGKAWAHEESAGWY